MSKRVTIMIDDSLDKKLRVLQAKRIEKENNSVSYSRVLNDCVRKGLKLDTIRENMKRRRGLQEPVEIEEKQKVEPTELTYQGYETISLSTCSEAFELFDEIVNSIGEGTFTISEKGYIKESLILVDKCLTIANTPKELVDEQDIQSYLKYSQKAIKLLEGIQKRYGIPFEYMFLIEYSR